MDWSGLVWSGSVWIGSDRFGQVRTGQVWRVARPIATSRPSALDGSPNYGDPGLLVAIGRYFAGFSEAQAYGDLRPDLMLLVRFSTAVSSLRASDSATVNEYLCTPRFLSTGEVNPAGCGEALRRQSGFKARAYCRLTPSSFRGSVTGAGTVRSAFSKLLPRLLRWHSDSNLLVR